MTKETIVAAAVLIKAPSPYDHLIVSSPPPARHGDLLAPLYLILGRIQPDKMGFLTSTGRFVGREEGMQIALASGQPMINHPSRNNDTLYSEDLW